jgi:hypothetical protein
LLVKLPPRLRARGVGGFASFLYLGQFASPFIVMALAGPFGGMPQGLAAGIMTWSSFTLLIAAAWMAVGLAKGGRKIDEATAS